MPSLQPVILTFSAIRNNITNVFVSESGINDLNQNSSVNNYITAAAMSDFRNQGNLLALLASQNIDQTTGSDLDKVGFAAGVPRPQAKTSSGFVTIGSGNITKIATQVYAGTAAPPAGSSIINIANGSAFPLTGSIYLGRGTANLEGPIPYTSVLPVGNYYQLNLSTPTTKNHNTSESVILAQGGNRTVSAGTTVQTTPNSTTAATQFTTTAIAVVPDGEVSITNVPVICTQAGSIGNAGAGSVNQIPSQPFPAAFVTNPTSIVNGQDYMSDPNYRNLIKASQQNKQKGTPLAIETAAIGVTSTDDNKTCTSSSYLSPANRNLPGILYIASGVNYQPVIYGQGFEPIIDNANGSEEYLQLQHEDVTKATLITAMTAPFNLTANMALSVKVGGVLSTHIFQATDFATQNAATADEVAASINNDTTVTFSARAISNSTQVAIFAQAYVNEDIQVVAPPSSYIDSNQYLGYSTNREFTLMLYENDALLYKDGVIPSAISVSQGNWNPVAFVSGCTLILAVDNTAPITLTFLDSDFNQFGYTVVAATNSLVSWATLITQKMPGVTAVVSGDQLQATSNKGASNGASLQIVGGTLVTSGNMFAAATYQGQSSNYALNRSTGQIQLVDTPPVGANITAGSQNTRGFTSSASFPTGATSLSITANDTVPRLFVILDQPATIVSNLVPSGTNLTVTNVGDSWTYTSVSGSAFSNVMVDDWALVQSSSIPDSDHNKGFWRVTSVSGSAFTVQKVNGTATTYVASGHDITFIRSPGLIQEIDFGTGAQSLGDLVASVNSQLVGGFATVQSATILRIFTNTFNFNGSIFVAGYNAPSTVLGFVVGDYDQSTVSSTAFAESQTSELTIPEFFHDYITADNGVTPPPVIDRTIDTNQNLSPLFPPNKIVSYLDAYANVSNNTGAYSLTGNIGTNTVLVRGNDEVRDIIANDRYFVAAPFQFSGEDNLVAILDEDPINKALNIAMYRNGAVSNQTPPTSTTFTGYDSDNGPTSNYVAAFGNNYSFEDFKVLFKAKQIIDPSGPNNAMIVHFYKFGATGNQCQVGIFYPTQPNSSVSSSVMVGSKTQIGVSLASSASEVGGWSNTSQFNTTNTAGNTWRYTWNGTGTAPNFTSSVPTPIAPGDVVTIASTSAFASNNQGTFLVTAVTATYFEVTNAAGSVQSNIQLNAASDFTFYELNSSLNTASAIGTYINGTLSNYISVAQLESGAGIIATSTMDDTGNPYVNLVDGENWLLSTNIGTTVLPTNAFTLKSPLSLVSSSSPPYSIVGEPYRIVPVMAAQISSFLNVFAVTGLSTIGNISVSSDSGRVQIYSDLFGSAGSVNVTGGTANTNTAAVLNSAFVVNGSYTSFDIIATDSAGFMSGQWVEIANDFVQAKDIVFSGATQLQVVASTPTVGYNSLTVTTGPGSFQTARATSADNTTQIKVEQQGQFVAFSWTGTGTNPNFTGGGLAEGDWVLVKGAFAQRNQGIFRVIKLFGAGTFYVENNSFQPQTVTMSGNSDLSFYSYDSAMPGDSVTVSNGVLGAANNGTYIVAYNPSLSVPFPTSTTVYLQSSSMVNNGPTPLGSNFNQVTVNEQTPFLAYRKIQNVALDPSNVNNYSVVVQGTALSGKINVNVGSSISVVGKFNFNTLVNSGVDSYKYYGGLIHAVGEVVRGEPFDPITYPGIAAAGSYLEIDVALPLPITISIVIRVVTGTPFSLLQSRVQSAVASYVNALGVNAPVVFSQIIAAANSVAGVQAVAIAAPTYNVTNNIITVPPNQEAVVENASTDIVVSLSS